MVTAVLADGISGDDLRTIALDLRNRFVTSVIALISSSAGKSVLVVAASDSARALGAKSGSLVKLGSAVLGGGGGGKDDFAQGGGTDASKSLEALAAITAAVAAL
jgi:alanyl-tRNA synthetase